MYYFCARRNGRVVECGGLENRCTVRYRGFESLFLRIPKSLLHKSATGIFLSEPVENPSFHKGKERKIPWRERSERRDFGMQDLPPGITSVIPNLFSLLKIVQAKPTTHERRDFGMQDLPPGITSVIPVPVFLIKDSSSQTNDP